MGDSGCLVQGFPYASALPSESNQGNAMYGLTDSVSFGRFMSESLCWERWSTFTHRKYVEEAERYAQPGSVAQKKAFFEAHYKGLGVRKSGRNVGVVYGLKKEESRSNHDVQTGEKGENRDSVCCESFSISSESCGTLKMSDTLLEENFLATEVESATKKRLSSTLLEENSLASEVESATKKRLSNTLLEENSLASELESATKKRLSNKENSLASDAESAARKRLSKTLLEENSMASELESATGERLNNTLLEENSLACEVGLASRKRLSNTLLEENSLASEDVESAMSTGKERSSLISESGCLRMSSTLLEGNSLASVNVESKERSSLITETCGTLRISNTLLEENPLTSEDVESTTNNGRSSLILESSVSRRMSSTLLEENSLSSGYVESTTTTSKERSSLISESGTLRMSNTLLEAISLAREDVELATSMERSSLILESVNPRMSNSLLEEISLASEDVESTTSNEQSSCSSIKGLIQVKQGNVPPAPAMPVASHQVKENNAAQSTAESGANCTDETIAINLVTNREPENHSSSMAPNDMDRECSYGEFGYPSPDHNQSKNQSMKSIDDPSDHPLTATTSPKCDVVSAVFFESSVGDGNSVQSPIFSTPSMEEATDRKQKVEVSKFSTNEKKKTHLWKTQKEKTGKRFSILACLCFKPDFPEETDFLSKDRIEKTLEAHLQAK